MASTLQRIVLTGFMGSGKTTVGRGLAARLDWQFLDLDDGIVAHSGKTVAELFAVHGEAHFRSLETEALATALNATQVVIALGGGALDAQANQTLLSASATTAVIHLTAPFETLCARCALQAEDTAFAVRPLLTDRANAAQRFAMREPTYQRVAHLRLDTERQSPSESVESAMTALSTWQA